ncbi:hypothetical protein B0H11DRAFT_2278471 [Mycena galericulata]|nr:hypothetical protein B0H11DRAFT_2278471 [Mycena galericulata]
MEEGARLHFMEDNSTIVDTAALQATADEIVARHRRMYAAEHGGLVDPTDKLTIWAHRDTKEPTTRYPTDQETPIWKITVKEGHEFDVVRTITAIYTALPPNIGLKSAFATALYSGTVYVEAEHESVISSL